MNITGRPVPCAFVLIFFCLLSLPLAVTVIRPESPEISVMENRRLASFPDLRAARYGEWPKLLDGWFKDHLATRGFCLETYTSIWQGVLKAPRLHVFTGKDGELFSLDTVKAYLGLYLFSREQLVEMKLGFAGYQGYCMLHGITFVALLSPDKPLYSADKLPDWVRWRKGPSHLEQLVDALRDTGITYIDLLPEMLRHKSTANAFDKTGDVWHWNGNGLDIAYKALLAFYNEHGASIPEAEYLASYGVEREKDTVVVRNKDLREYADRSEEMPPVVSEYGWDAPKFYENGKAAGNNTLLMSDSNILSTHGSTYLPLVHFSRAYMHLTRGAASFANLDAVRKLHTMDFAIRAYVERTISPPIHSSPEDDMRVRILGDTLLETPGYILHPSVVRGARLNNCAPAENGRFPAYEDSPVWLLAGNGGPEILLQPVHTDSDGRAMVSARITVPGDSVAKVIYRPSGNGDIPEQSVSVPVRRGENMIHLSFYGNAGEQLLVRFSPGELAGEYGFSVIEDVVLLRELMASGESPRK